MYGNVKCKSALRKSLLHLCQCGKLNIKLNIYDKKAIAQDIYDLLFHVPISRKLQLSSVVTILSLCPVASQLQSCGVLPCIVTH